MSNTKQKNDADLQQTFDIFNNNKDVNKDIKMESKNMDIKNNINNIESLEDITGQTPNHQEANEELELSEEQKQKLLETEEFISDMQYSMFLQMLSSGFGKQQMQMKGFRAGKIPEELLRIKHPNSFNDLLSGVLYIKNMSLLSLKKQATITQVMKDNGGFKVIYNITDINDNSSTNQSTNKED